jgi:hypothetical protein
LGKQNLLPDEFASFLSSAHPQDKIGCFYTSVALESELIGRVIDEIDNSNL